MSQEETNPTIQESKRNPVRFLEKRGWRRAGASWWKRPGDQKFISQGDAIRLEIGDAVEAQDSDALCFAPNVNAALKKEGYETLSSLESLTDEQLTAIKGIADKGLEQIRETVPAPEQSEDPESVDSENADVDPDPADEETSGDDAGEESPPDDEEAGDAETEQRSAPRRKTE